MTRSHVFANSMAFPPTPQNASMMTSDWQRRAMCWAMACGVTLNQPVSSMSTGRVS
jgi:hypothetical protein